MTRNSKKFQKQLNPSKQNPKTKEDLGPDNLFGLSFVSPSEMVLLPTKGKFYPSSNPLCGLEEVEVRHMTAKEEDLLSGASGRVEDKLFNKLINSLLVDKNIKAEMLCEEDKTAILIHARITGYGNAYTTSDYCLNCNQMVQVKFDLSEQQIVEPEKEEISFDPEKNEFNLVLPKTKIPITIKNFTEEDHNALEKEKAKKESLGLEFNYTVSYLKTIILAIAEKRDPKLVQRLVDVLPAADAKFLNTVFESCRPKISTMQEITCPECNSVSRKEVPVSWAFFRINK